MARPRKEEAIDIPARAVAETVGLLAHHDVAAITMADVAAAVGCRAPALYNHFRNKDALLRAVHDAGFVKLYDEKLAVAARTGGDAFARLREGGIAYLRFAAENPALYRLMFNAPPAGLPGNPFETDIGMRLLGFLRASIVGCQSLGYLPGHDPDLVAFTLWSTVHGAASLTIQNRIPAAIGDQATLNAAIVDAVMAMIEATRPRTPSP